MIPMRSATTSSSAAFAPSSRQDRTAPRRSATTSGFIVSATASSGHSATSRSTAPSPHDMISSPIASFECYISQPRVTGSNLSTRPRRQYFAIWSNKFAYALEVYPEEIDSFLRDFKKFKHIYPNFSGPYPTAEEAMQVAKSRKITY